MLELIKPITNISEKSTITIKINIKETWKHKIALKGNQDPTMVHQHKESKIRN